MLFEIEGNGYAFATRLVDGSVVSWGEQISGGDNSAVRHQLRNVQKIYSTYTAFAALLSNGSAVTWGNPCSGGESSAVQQQLQNVKGSSFASMEELVALGSSAGVNDLEVAVLLKAGWSMSRLAAIEGLGPEVFETVVERCKQLSDSFVADADMIKSLAALAEKRVSVLRCIEAKRGSADLLEAHVSHQREVRSRVLDERVVEVMCEKVQSHGAAKRVKWPTRLGKSLHHAGEDMALREAAERRERERWIKELKHLLAEAKLPAMRGSNEGKAFSRIAKGRRPATLRKHVKTWLKVQLWLRHTHEVSWPERPEQFAEYIEAIVQEPCAKSTPVSVYKTFMFLEFAGEVPEAAQQHRAPPVQNSIEEAKVALESSQLRPKRQANLLPLTVIAAWEEQVCDSDTPSYVRCYAWYRLVKLWSGMRFNDTQGVLNKTMKSTEYGLYGEIHRSKTSGPGKKLAILPFYVNKAAWICKQDWLGVGWRLWRELGVEAGMEARDFMLPRPNANLTKFVRRMVDYSTAASMSQALFGRLWLLASGQRCTLLFPGVGLLWSEHSERATLRTWAQGARIADDHRKQLGRWQPSTDEGYQRAARANILNSQEDIASFARASVGGPDPFDENSVIQKAIDLMEEHGYPLEARAEQAQQLMSFRPRWVPVEGGNPPPQWAERMMAAGRDGGGIASSNEPREALAESEDEGAVAKSVGVESVQGRYVVSIVGRSKSRTLHRVGECHRQPGVHYTHFEVLGDEAPAPDTYHRACKICFPRGSVLTGPSESESSDEVSSSDETTSGEEQDLGDR
eukprot:s228_g23.t1